MKPTRKHTALIALSAPALALLPSGASAAPPDRIGAIDDSQTVTLEGNVRAEAQPRYDLGPVPPAFELDRIKLLIQPSPAQQAALDRLLAEQQDRSSPAYHRWLTPEQYAERFGLSQSDVDRITAWLRSRGLTVVAVARGKNRIELAGTARRIQEVFRTEIHRYRVRGETHFANSKAPSIPRGLVGVVSHIRGLDDFRWKPHATRIDGSPGLPDGRPAPGAPGYSRGKGGPNYLAPDDIATIYGIAPLYAGGIDGSGQKLAVVGQTDLPLAGIDAFRAMFKLPAAEPMVIDLPGHKLSDGDLDEARLDVEWAGAVARGATILYVNGATVLDAVEHAIDNQLASVISMSYGSCESTAGPEYAHLFQTQVRQANAQGITFVAASGDTGPAACEKPTSSTATSGLGVELPASVPEVTGVGGTRFAEGSGSYWGPNSPTDGSALSYIPEVAWNDSDLFNALTASGGGKSNIFPKPAWQAGPGVPADSRRDVPDVALTASSYHDPYIVCAGGDCPGRFESLGGTSAAAPVFAGILTLLNQVLVATGAQAAPGLGNVNPILYEWAQAGKTPFHDVTAGNTLVSCQQGSKDCPGSAPYRMGFQAGPGYDLATGLGSIDAHALAQGWSAVGKTPTTTVVAADPGPAVNAGTPVTLTATVTPTSGSQAPTGQVVFTDASSGTKLGSAALAGGAAVLGSAALAPAILSVVATYSGDAAFAGSASPPLALKVEDFTLAAEPTTLTIASRGGSGDIAITVTPLGGFDQPLTFTCTGLPSGAGCSAVATGQGATLTIGAIGAGAAPQSAQDRRPLPLHAMLPAALGGMIGPFGSRRRAGRGKRTRFPLLLLLLSLGAIGAAACGNGGSPAVAIPPGTSDVTVTASTSGPAPLSRSIAVTLVVQ